MRKKKNKKRKAIRFRKLTFKLTSGQMASLEAYCRRHATTPVKVIKQRLSPFLKLPNNLKKESTVHPQQLQIFDMPGYVESNA